VIRRKPPYLTDTGEQILSYARRIWLLQVEMDNSILNQTPIGERLSIAVNHDSLSCWFLSALQSFSQATGMFVDIKTADSQQTEELFQKGQVLAAVTSSPNAIPGCKSKPLGVLEYETVCSADFADRYFPNGVTADALRRAPGLYYDRKDQIAVGMLDKFGVHIGETRRHFIPGSAELDQAVRMGLGWCTNPVLLSTINQNGSKLIRLVPETVGVGLYWKTWDLASSQITALTKHVFRVSRERLEPFETTE
jgi:LysR family transcriptional regulator (chromosome initiation inhibitor)